ncbi:MAG: YceI family protein [Vicinamibacterales bacterium]
MRLTSLILLVVVAAQIAAAGGVTYAVDPAASRLTVEVGKEGLFSFAGHTHRVSAPVAEGMIDVDPADLSQSVVRLTFDASRLKLIADGEAAGDVPEIQRTMASARVLDVSRFPRIAFASRRIEILSRDATHVRLRVTGDLTLHGVTKAESGEVAVTLATDRLSATGTFGVKQTDFGIQSVTAAGGTVRVKDEVTIQFSLVALSRQAE